MGRFSFVMNEENLALVDAASGGPAHRREFITAAAVAAARVRIEEMKTKGITPWSNPRPPVR